MAVIEVRELTKRFGPVLAVADRLTRMDAPPSATGAFGPPLEFQRGDHESDSLVGSSA